MAGSAADTPETPDYLRVSDAERDRAISALRQEFVEGRLSRETFVFRMQSALGARHRGQLTGLFTDLPPRRARLLDRVRAVFRRGDPDQDGAGGHNQTGAPGLPAPMVFPPGSGTSFTIGRTQDCDLRIADLSVSRHHARLDRGQEGWLISDLGSRNGTRVNGWLVREPVPVRPGYLLQFGSATFIVQGDVATGHPPVSGDPEGMGAGGPATPGKLYSVTTVLLVRHGLTATTGHVLTGWTPGIPLDDRGRAQAAALAARLAPLRLDAIVSSPLERCVQTASVIAAGRDGQQVATDDRVGECRYGDWTGRPLKKLATEKLWRVVQAHPSAVRFPGPDGESMPDMQHRAVAAVRDWNARLGQDATYLICSHGDVIKAIVADSLGLHLDQCQRIQADPCSLTVIRYTPLRPFLVRMNDRGGGVDDLMPHVRGSGTHGAAASDAVVGGGSGGADQMNGQVPVVPSAAAPFPAPDSRQQAADTRG